MFVMHSLKSQLLGFKYNGMRVQAMWMAKEIKGLNVPSLKGVNLDPPKNIFQEKEYSEHEVAPKQEEGGLASKWRKLRGDDEEEGDEGEYKNYEYFKYHKESYYEMEIVMAKLRVPQPIAIPNLTTPTPK